MELETLGNIEKIASKLKIQDRKKRQATAKELNELAKVIIDWKRKENETSDTIH
jgi:MinD-like ATPase involved in chromosome partitioning or flagellar assembly